MKNKVLQLQKIKDENRPIDMAGSYVSFGCITIFSSFVSISCLFP